jgi:hypothetical protein
VTQIGPTHLRKRIWLSEKPIQGRPAVVERGRIKMFGADAGFDPLCDDGERPCETLAQPIVPRRAAKDVAASVNA